MKNNIVAEISVSYSYAVKPSERTKVRTSQEAYKLFKAHWNMDLIELQEHCSMLLLNPAADVLGIYNLSKGGTNTTIVDARLVFGIALKTNAAALIFCHNHPSGRLTPSLKDIALTKKFKKGAELLDIQLTDHLIITKEAYYSFADSGNL